MKVRACFLVSLVAGCGLVQVNGKPLGGTSSPPPSSGASSPGQNASTEPASQPASNTPSASSPAAEPAAVSEAPGGKSLDDLGRPGAKRAAWTPVLQYKALSDRNDAYPALIVADELGDRLSQAGRLGLIEKCFERQPKDVSSAALWAACGADVEAFDFNAFGKELQKEGLSGDARKRLFDGAKETLAEAKAIGAAVTLAAKDDPGVASIVAMGQTARQEWQTFAAEHADQLAVLAKLQDLVREDKNGLAGDCIEETQPAMEKVARATKWRERDIPVDPSDVYVNQLPKTTDAFISVVAWGACLALTHKSGDAIYGSAMNTQYGYSQQQWRRYHRRGPRTLTVAKLYDDAFKPKFASRSLEMRNGIKEPRGNYSAERSGVQTPHDAIIAKLVKNGNETTIKFAKDKVMECVDWRDTNKVQSITTGGSIMYEKKCMKRQAVDNEYSDVVTSTAFTSGLGPGVQLTEQYSFPVVGMKGSKFVAALGVKL